MDGCSRFQQRGKETPLDSEDAQMHRESDIEGWS
jgi:hypothetical protein